MRVVGGLVEEQILHHHAFHGGEAGGHVAGVRIRLHDVLALDVETLEAAIDGGVEHVGDAQAWLRIELHAPQPLEHLSHVIGSDVAIAGEFMREGAHVAGALDIVLAP